RGRILAACRSGLSTGRQFATAPNGSSSKPRRIASTRPTPICSGTSSRRGAPSARTRRRRSHTAERPDRRPGLGTSRGDASALGPAGQSLREERDQVGERVVERCFGAARPAQREGAVGQYVEIPGQRGIGARIQSTDRFFSPTAVFVGG